MEKYSEYLLKQIGKKDVDESTNKIIATHIQMMLFNIIGVISTVALLKNEKVISLEDVNTAKAKFNLKCHDKHKLFKKLMKGGANMASEFFGINSGSYNVSNGDQGTVMSKIDFNVGIARPELGPGGGLLGGGKQKKVSLLKHKEPKKYIKLALEYHNVKFNKASKDETYKIIESYLLCLLNELKKKKKLGGENVATIFKDKDYVVFN